MNKKNNEKVDEIIRVNHAGEFGAQVIYKSQIKFSKDKNLKKELKRISDEEMVHFKYFDEEITKNRTRPTVMQPIWKVGGYVLGAVSSILGEKYVHACTEAVESTIVDHYNEQIEFLKKAKIKNDLRIKIQKFCDEEKSHKENSTKKIDSTDKSLMVFKGLTKIATKAAIKISKQI